MIKLCKNGLKLKYTAAISGDTWTGSAVIPESYFPFQVTKWNAYAIHDKETRVYEALYPVGYQEFKEPNL
jgi:hypothetical protein